MDRSESVVQVNYRYNRIRFLGDKFLKTQNWNESFTSQFHKVWMMLHYPLNCLIYGLFVQYLVNKKTFRK